MAYSMGCYGLAQKSKFYKLRWGKPRGFKGLGLSQLRDFGSQVPGFKGLGSRVWG